MGKDKKKRHKPGKFDPVESPSDIPLLDDEQFQGTVSNVVEMLGSTNSEERECGCATIANFMSQAEIIPQLLRSNAIKIMAPLMIDPNQSVRCAALGALRNLSVDGGEDLCNKMVQEDVLTCLTALLGQYELGWLPDSGGGAQSKDIKSEIFVQAVNLLLNLCEYSDTAVKIVNQHQLLTLLVSCINPDKYDYGICTTAAQCIYTTSESNPAAASLLASNLGSLDSLIQRNSDSTEFIFLRTLVTGIAYNVILQQEEAAHAGVVHKIVKVLSDTLTQDITKSLEMAVQALKELPSNEIPDNSMETAESVSEKLVGHPERRSHTVDKSLEDVSNIINAQRVALEMIANLCCSNSEDDNWEDMDSDGSMEDLKENMDAEMNQNSNAEIASKLEVEVQEAIVQEEIAKKVLSKCDLCMMENSVCDQLSSYSSGTKVLKGIETCSSRALLCLANLMGSYGTETLGGTELVQGVWIKLSKLLTHTRVVESEDLLDGVSSALRSIAQKLVEINPNQFNEVTQGDLEVLYEMGLKCNVDQIRANAISIVCTIGSSLAKNASPNPLLQNVGAFLLEVIARDSQLWVVAEALDATFDVFADDQTNPVIRQILLIEKLQEFVPVLKQRVKSEKRTLGEHLPIVSTARTNLVRFIQYKQKVMRG